MKIVTTFKKYFVHFLVSLLTVLGIGIVFFAVKNKPQSNEIQLRDGGNDFGQFTITWVSDGHTRSKGIIDQNDHSLLKVNPIDNDIYDQYNNIDGGVQLTYHLLFNMGGSDEAPPGALKIKIPKDIFIGRDGQPIPNQIKDIPLVPYPQTAGTDFNYRFEVDPNDGKNYIILENYSTIPPSYAFECSLTWVLTAPSDLANGYETTITGNVSLDIDLDGTIETEATSNTLKMKYFSHVAINAFSEDSYQHTDSDSGESVNVFKTWNSSWKNTIKPQNPDDYYYAIWRTSGNVYQATEPYTATITSQVTDNLGGEVIGYCYSSYSYNDSSCFTGNNVTANPYTFNITTPSKTYNNFDYTFIMVKYPKTALNTGIRKTLKNQATLSITGADGDTDTKTVNTSSTFRYAYVEPTTVEREVPFVPSSSSTASNSVSKSGYSTVHGGINALEGNKSVYAGNSKTASTSTARYYNFSSSNSMNYNYLTLKDDGNLEEPDDYGQKSWKAINIDDAVFMGDDTDGYERLTDGDYEFTTFSIYEYTVKEYVYKTWTSSSGKTTYINTGWTTQDVPYATRAPVKIYYKKNGEWIYYADVTATNSSYSYNYTLADGTQYNNKSYSSTINGEYGIPLPKGVTGIKGVVTSKNYSVSINIFIHVNVLPSQHVKSLIEGKDSIRLYNYNSSLAQDSEGNYYSRIPENNSSAVIGIEEIKNVMDQQDLDEFGINVLHYHYTGRINGQEEGSTGYYTLYNRIKDGHSSSGKWVRFESDSAERRIRANYTAVAYESSPYNREALTPQDVLEYKIISEQRIGTFYDLLPRGMTVNMSSISVETLNISNSDTTSVSSANDLGTGTPIPFTVSKIENYKNTGRIMIIVKATLPSDAATNYIDRGSTYYTSTKVVLSGMVLKFSGYYDWDRIPDFGDTLTNTVAYKSGSGPLCDGYPDNSFELGSEFVDRYFMYDLDEDGNLITINDTIYAQNTGTFDFNTASDSSFKKGVSTPTIEDYVDGKDGSAVVTAGGYYSYRLRYASQKNLTTTGLVLYDVFEDYDNENPNRWKGEFVEIDVSQPELKGANPVIYYSTADPNDINIYENGKAAQSLPSGVANLQNNPKWTRTIPQDKSTITAIAIDLSKKPNGTAFSLLSEESVVITVTMQAPMSNVQELVDNHAKARNASWWSGYTKQGSDPQNFSMSVFEWTELGISTPNLSIKKEAFVLDSEGELAESQSIVHLGDTIVYDLQVENISDYESVTKVKLVDNLPANVEPLYDDIKFYYEGEGDYSTAISINESSVVKTNYENNDIALDVSQLLSGQKIHILLPTHPRVAESKTITNSFKLMGYNGKRYQKTSNNVTHELKTGHITIKKSVTGDGADLNKYFEFKVHLYTPSRYQEVQAMRMDEESAQQQLRLNDNFSIGRSLLAQTNVMTIDGTSTNKIIELPNDPTINGEFGGLTFENGIATARIKHGERLLLTDMPSGCYYIIEELDYSKQGYTATSVGEEALIEDDKTKNVEFTNAYEKYIDPTPGPNPSPSPTPSYSPKPSPNIPIHNNPQTATKAQALLIIIMILSSIVAATWFTFNPINKTSNIDKTK